MHWPASRKMRVKRAERPGRINPFFPSVTVMIHHILPKPGRRIPRLSPAIRPRLRLLHTLERPSSFLLQQRDLHSTGPSLSSSSLPPPPPPPPESPESPEQPPESDNNSDSTDFTSNTISPTTVPVPSYVPSTVPPPIPYSQPPFDTHRFIRRLEWRQIFSTSYAEDLMHVARALLVDRMGKVRREALTVKDLDNVRLDTSPISLLD